VSIKQKQKKQKNMYNQELTADEVKARQERAKIEKEKIGKMIRLIKLQLDQIADNLDLLSDEDCEELLEDLKKSIIL